MHPFCFLREVESANDLSFIGGRRALVLHEFKKKWGEVVTQ